MLQPNLRALIAGVTVPLALFLASGSALAHGKHSARPNAAPVQGTVTGWDATTLQIQTQTGGVSVSVASSTHIIRQAIGSVTDLRGSAHVDVDLAQGTTTITAIRIDDTTHSRHGQSLPGKPDGTHPRHGKQPSGPSSHGTPAPHIGPHSARSHISGQVVATRGNTVTLRDSQGKVSSYTLGRSVTITKVMDGTAADLAVGESVRAVPGHGGAAVAVTILHA